jgi:pimeloyl-ACP methyl ester carboxylesterase
MARATVSSRRIVPTAYSRSLRIQYNDLARGSPAFLCLPGWCENKTAFARITHALGRDHRVIALDWRGHGKSAASGIEFGHAELVEDALAVVRTAGIGPLVTISVSHAGWVALELRRLLSERVVRMVFLDWILAEPPPEFRATLADLQDRDRWSAARSELFRRWIGACEVPHVARHVREEMGSYGFEMWARAAREVERAYLLGTPLDALAGFDPPAPVLHLYSQPRDPAYLAAQQDFARARPWFHVRRLDGRSHFPALERPDDVAAAILEFADAGSRRAGPFSTRNSP